MDGNYFLPYARSLSRPSLRQRPSFPLVLSVLSFFLDFHPFLDLLPVPSSSGKVSSIVPDRPAVIANETVGSRRGPRVRRAHGRHRHLILLFRLSLRRGAPRVRGSLGFQRRSAVDQSPNERVEYGSTNGTVSLLSTWTTWKPVCAIVDFHSVLALPSSPLSFRVRRKLGPQQGTPDRRHGVFGSLARPESREHRDRFDCFEEILLAFLRRAFFLRPSWFPAMFR